MQRDAAGTSEGGAFVSDFDHYEPRAGEHARATDLDIGDILGTTARAIADNIAQFGIIALVCLTPSIVATFFYELAIQEWAQTELQEWAQRAMSPENPEALFADPEALFAELADVIPGWLIPGGILLWVLQLALSVVAQAAMLYGTVEFMAGRKASVGAALVKGIGSAPVVIVISILSGVAVTFGLLTCLVPGFIVLCVLYVAVPVAVMEGAGPLDALQRSAELTSGHRVMIFLSLFIFFAASVTLSCLTQQFSSLGVQVLPSTASFVVLFIINQLLIVGQTVLFATLNAVIYARIRGVRDGVDADTLAQVFA